MAINSYDCGINCNIIWNTQIFTIDKYISCNKSLNINDCMDFYTCVKHDEELHGIQKGKLYKNINDVIGDMIIYCNKLNLCINDCSLIMASIKCNTIYRYCMHIYMRVVYQKMLNYTEIKIIVVIILIISKRKTVYIVILNQCKYQSFIIDFWNGLER